MAQDRVLLADGSFVLLSDGASVVLLATGSVDAGDELPAHERTGVANTHRRVNLSTHRTGTARVIYR